MAMMMGMIATMRLNARPDAKLNTQSLLNFVIHASIDVNPLTVVCLTAEELEGLALVEGVSFICTRSLSPGSDQQQRYGHQDRERRLCTNHHSS